jgi:hypothetical protein
MKQLNAGACRLASPSTAEAARSHSALAERCRMSLALRVSPQLRPLSACAATPSPVASVNPLGGEPPRARRRRRGDAGSRTLLLRRRRRHGHVSARPRAEEAAWSCGGAAAVGDERLAIFRGSLSPLRATRLGLRRPTCPSVTCVMRAAVASQRLRRCRRCRRASAAAPARERCLQRSCCRAAVAAAFARRGAAPRLVHGAAASLRRAVISASPSCAARCRCRCRLGSLPLPTRSVLRCFGGRS